MEKVSYQDFEKLDIRVAKIKAVKQHPNADKLYILLLDIGEDEQDKEVVAGLKEHYKEEELLDKKILFIHNLEPRTVRGVASEGMILAADDGENPVTITTVDREVNNGAKIH